MGFQIIKIGCIDWCLESLCWFGLYSSSRSFLLMKMLFWVILSSLCALVVAAPLNSNTTCKNPKIRKEW
jgi:hypothetical protein